MKKRPIHTTPHHPPDSFVTGGGGTDFEQQVGAIHLAFLLSGQNPPELNGTVTEVGFQQGFRNVPDDLVITYNDSRGEQRKLALQVKHRLRFTGGDLDFSRIIRDCWKTFNGEAPTSFDRDKDGFGIVVGKYTQGIDVNIKRVLDVARRSASAKDFDEKRGALPRNQKQFVSLIENLIADEKGESPTPGEVFGFLKCFNVFHFSPDPDGRDMNAARNTLMTVTAHDAAKANTLLGHLLSIAAEYNPTGGNMTRSILRSLCSQFELGPYPLLKHDIDAMNRYAQSCLDSIHDTTGDDVRFERRHEQQKILAQLSKSEMVVMRGEPLVGKSVLLKMLMRDHLDAENCVFFKAARLEGNSLQSFLRKIGVENDFPKILESYGGRARHVLIDGLEHAADPNRREIINEIITAVKAHNEEIAKHDASLCWKILCTGRTLGLDDVMQDLEVRRWLQCGTLECVGVSGLSEQEAEPLLVKLPHLKHMLSNRGLGVFFLRPGILDLVAKPRFPTDHDTLGQICSESQFAEIFWSRIVCSGNRKAAKEQLTLRIAEHTILRQHAKITERGVDPDALDELLADRILRREGPALVFAHDYVEDMAWALLMSGSLADLLGKMRDGSDSPRLAAAFRLLSQYLLDVKQDPEKWLSNLDLIRNKSAFPRWETEWIAAPMLAPTFGETFRLLSGPLRDQNGLLAKFLVALRTRCVNRDGDRAESFARGGNDAPDPRHSAVPISAKWKTVLQSTVGDLGDAGGAALLEFSRIFCMWMRHDEERGEITRQVATTCVDLCSTYLPCKKRDIPVTPDAAEEFCDNLVLSVLNGTDVIPDQVRSFLRTHAMPRSSTSRKMESAIFKMGGWLPVCRHLPDVFVELMTSLLCRRLTLDGVRLEPRDLGIKDISHAHASYMGPFYTFLLQHPEKGLELIHRIVNHSTLAWRVRERAKSPAIHTLRLPGKTINLWGDDLVYCWFRFPCTGSPTVCRALTALEVWLDDSVKKGRDLSELVATVLSKTNCVAVVGVCCSVILANASKADPSILVPILENPAYWLMDGHRLEHEIFDQGRNAGMLPTRKNPAAERPFRKIFPQSHRERPFYSLVPDVLLSADRALKDRLVDSVMGFEENPPHYFKRLDPILAAYHKGTDVEEVKNRCRVWALHADMSNYKKIKKDGRVELVVDPMDHLTEKDRARETELENQRTIINSWMHACQFLKSGDAGSDPSLRGMIAYAKKLDGATQRTPEQDVVGFITNLAAALVVWKWDLVVERDLVEWCVSKITQASTAPVRENSLSVYPEAPSRAVAKSLPHLYLRTKRKHVKIMIKSFSQHPVNEVRNCLFSSMKILWESEPELVLECSADRIKATTGKKSLSDCDPLAIASHTLTSVIHAMPDAEELRKLPDAAGALSLMDDLLDITIKEYQKPQDSGDYHVWSANHEWNYLLFRTLGGFILHGDDGYAASATKKILSNQRNAPCMLADFLRQLLLVCADDGTKKGQDLWRTWCELIVRLDLNPQDSKDLAGLLIFDDDQTSPEWECLFKEWVKAHVPIVQAWCERFGRSSAHFPSLIRMLKSIGLELMPGQGLDWLHAILADVRDQRDFLRRSGVTSEFDSLLSLTWKLHRTGLVKDDRRIAKFSFLVDLLADLEKPLSSALQHQLEHSMRDGAL